jgi:hypothetical protein
MSHPRVGSRTRAAAALATGLAITLLAFVPVPAWAHGDEDNPRAFDLVRQAIALIVNLPTHTDEIEDKIKDAAESEDTSDVQVPLVEQAMEALDAGDLHRTRALLEQSIGARVHTGDADPVVIGKVPPPTTGEETGTLAAIDALPGRHGLQSDDWALLAISIALAAAGIALSFTLRPHIVHGSHREVTG